MWELSNGAGRTFDAEISEGREGFLIHHDRSYMREHRSQAGQNLEALRVQIAPVEDGALGQPGDASQVVDHEAATKKCEGVLLGWQREKGHLVFGDDAALPAQQIKRHKLRGRNAQFSERQVITFL